MTRRWPVALFYNMIDVSAVSAYVLWQQLHGENNRIVSKKRRKFLIRLGRELAGISSAMSMQKRRAIQPQSSRKRSAATENQATNAIFVKEAKIENPDKHAALAITTFVKNIRKLFACNAITNRLKPILLVVNICSMLNAL